MRRGTHSARTSYFRLNKINKGSELCVASGMHIERFKTRLNSPNTNNLIRNFRSSFVGWFDLPFPRSPSLVIQPTTAVVRRFFAKLAASDSAHSVTALIEKNERERESSEREANCVQILICVPFLLNYVVFDLLVCIRSFVFVHKPCSIVSHTRTHSRSDQRVTCQRSV